MKKIILFFFILIFGYSYGQQDSIPKIKLGEVVISATRTERGILDVPAQVDLIKADEIEDHPVANFDDLLRGSANVYVNRSWGIFSKNSSVTMRGLESSSRILILIDGIPKNKLSGGSVNWHNINPNQVERIEIIKGPVSALYGNNSMGGVINIITKKPVKKLQGRIKSFIGSYGTWGGSMDLSGNMIKEDKGIYWNIFGNYREGDGYIYEPPEFIDETDIKTYLQEYGGGGKLGYQFDPQNSIEVNYNYYDELRGAGRKVFEELGSHDLVLSHQAYVKYRGTIGKGNINAALYSNFEDYGSLKESLNDYQEYRLSDTKTMKKDQGFWLTYSKPFKKIHHITSGFEYKQGSVIGDEIYRTSSDMIHFEGSIDAMGFFGQDEIKLIEKKLSMIAGFRYDIVSFRNGYQEVINPTKITGFSESFQENFDNKKWHAFNPKLSLQYAFKTDLKLYVSVATGFRPPKIDDLVKSGKIRKGFRLANPDLKPESLINYELGGSRYWENLSISSAVYYTRGNDFHYLVGTGDSIDTGGSSLKPILFKDNIVKIQIIGGEFSLNYHIGHSLELDASYAYNHSTILEYDASDINLSKELEGKYIVEVSPNLFYAGLRWKNQIVNTQINCSYNDEQWFDDENTILVEDYFVVNMKLSKSVFKQWKIYLDVFNIFNKAFVDRKGQLSPGRFIVGGIEFSIN